MFNYLYFSNTSKCLTKSYYSFYSVGGYQFNTSYSKTTNFSIKGRITTTSRSKKHSKRIR